MNQTMTHPEVVSRQHPSEMFGSLTLAWQAIAQRLEGRTAQNFREFVINGVAMSKEDANAVGEVVPLS